jgi:hypothetical protein
MLKTSVPQRRIWFTFVNQRLEGTSVMREEGERTEDLIDFQVGRDGNANFQEGNEMGSVKDLIDFQEGRSKTSNFQVGKEDE